jgi:uridine kinase
VTTPAAASPARTLVAIDGIDGSGKSIFAARLGQALDADAVPAVLFHVDDFRRAVDWSRADRAELDTYYDDYYDLTALDDCLRAFLGGSPAVAITLSDLTSGAPQPPRRIDLAGVAVAIVEGVFVRRLPTVTASAAIIAIETSAAEARRRILARDVAKGRSEAEIAHRIAARYFPAQERYRTAAAGQPAPAVVVNNETPGSGRIVSLDRSRVPAVVQKALGRLFPGAAPP